MLCTFKILICARDKKSMQGEDFYVTFVPEPSVENVLRVAPYDVFSGIESSRSEPFGWGG
jgi:hypothetical protein